jgi:Transposase IS200 like
VTEYHHSAHAVWDIKYRLIWITKYRYTVLRGEVAERARDLLRQICAAREVRIIRGRCRRTTSTFGGRAAAVGAGEARAISEGALVADVARGLSALAQAVRGPASVGARVLLRDGGRGRRKDGDGIHRVTEMGPGRRRIQSRSAQRALSRLSAGAASGGFSREPTFSRNRSLSPFRRSCFQPIGTTSRKCDSAQRSNRTRSAHIFHAPAVHRVSSYRRS